jgi:hypothetical protein
LSSIRPVSAPSHASFLNESLASIQQEDDYIDDNNYSDVFVNDYSQSVYENQSYNYGQPRTVPPFYDTTTHRDEYTWKYTIPDRYIDDDYEEFYNRQDELPEFNNETTHRETYQEFELIPPTRYLFTLIKPLLKHGNFWGELLLFGGNCSRSCQI